MLHAIGSTVDPWQRALLVVSLLLFASFASAQPASVTDDRIQAGDAVAVVLPEQTGDRIIEATVDERGEVALGIYGRVQIAGLTEAQALEAVQRSVRSLLRNTSSVRLTVQQRGLLIFVTGAVESPGMLAVPRSADMWSAIRVAGGPLAGADLRAVTLMRGSTVAATVDLRAYLTRASVEPLPQLQAGDSIFVPAASTMGGTVGSESISLPAEWAGKVFVMGAVEEAGVYDLDDGATALTALALAGGPSTEANLQGARLVTSQGSTAINLASVLSGLEPDPVLAPDSGMILYVPALTEGSASPFVEGVTVIGMLNGARFVATNTPIDLFEALGHAGGPAETADLRRVRHIHRAEGVTVAAEYNARRFLRNGGALGTVRVFPGDVIYLRTRRPNAWETFVGGFSDVAVISSAFLLFVTVNNQLGGAE